MNYFGKILAILKFCLLYYLVNFVFVNFANAKKPLPHKAILPQSSIEYQFTITENNFSGLQFRFLRSSSANNGELLVNLKELESGKSIFSEKINYRDIFDYQAHVINFDKIENSKDKKFLLDLQDIAANEDSPVKLMFLKEEKSNYNITHGGKPLKNLMPRIKFLFNNEVGEVDENIMVGQILPKRPFEYQFTCQEDVFSGFNINFATYKRELTSHLRIKLFQRDSGEKILSKEIRLSNLSDNKPKIFYFDPIINSKGKKFVLKLISKDGEKGNAVTVWLQRSQNSIVKYGKKILNAEPHLDFTYGSDLPIKYADKLHEILPLTSMCILILIVIACILPTKKLVSLIKKFNWEIKFAFMFLIFLPPAFIFLMVQYSALDFQHWDHGMVMIDYLKAFYDGDLTLAKLFEPYAHTVPAFYRFLIIINSALTNWNVRSEYIYLFLAIVASHIYLLHLLWKIFDKQSRLLLFLFALLLSILIFSPVNYRNHYWAVMFQYNLAQFFSIVCLTFAVAYPNRLLAHIVAISAGWLASFTLTSGIIAIIASTMFLNIQSLFNRKIKLINIFWIINTIAIIVIYTKLAHLDEAKTSASLSQITYFIVVYLLLPIRGLLFYPYYTISSGTQTYTFNFIFSIIALLLVIFLAFKYRKKILQFTLGANLFMVCTLFGLGSAFITALARANLFNTGPYAYAESSRYAVFSTIFVVGILLFLAEILKKQNLFRNQNLKNKLWQMSAILILPAIIILCSVNTYLKSVDVYYDCHQLNKKLAKAFTNDALNKGHSEYDGLVFDLDYVDKNKVQRFREIISKYRLGAYKYDNSAND